MASPSGTVAEGAPIIPISAQLKYNIEVICEYVTRKIPIPERNFTDEPRLIGEWGERAVRKDQREGKEERERNVSQ